MFVMATISQSLLRHFAFVVYLVLFCSGEKPELVVSFNSRASVNEVTLECIEGGSMRPAIFTFRNPLTGDVERRVTTTINQPLYTVTVLPQNETVICCRVHGASEESEKMIITGLLHGKPIGRPQYPNIIIQYVYSDSDTAELHCPFEFGRSYGLISPYTFGWVVSQNPDGLRAAPIPNGTHDAFYDNADGTILHVSIPLPTFVYSFQCRGTIRLCNSSAEINNIACRSKTTNSPFIFARIIDKVIINQPPSNATAISGSEVSVFSCTASGGASLSIDWEVNGVMYSERCGNRPSRVCNSNLTSSINEGNISSTLVLSVEDFNPTMDVALLTVVCVAKQMLDIMFVSPPENTTEIRLPRITSRTVWSIPVQLRLYYKLTTTTDSIEALTAILETIAPTFYKGLSKQNIYVAFGVTSAVLCITITVLSSILFLLLCYHYHTENSSLGRALRSHFLSRSPSNRESSTNNTVPLYDSLCETETPSISLPPCVSQLDTLIDQNSTIVLNGGSNQFIVSTNTAYETSSPGASALQTTKNVAYEQTAPHYHHAPGIDHDYENIDKCHQSLEATDNKHENQMSKGRSQKEGCMESAL